MQAEGVHRPARAEISASALAHNVRALKSVVGQSLFCAVVKANGYGHGAELAAKAALVGGADMLAVAIIDEGIELRSTGVTAPILLLAEVPPDTIEAALRHSLTLTVGSIDGARAAAAIAVALGGRHAVHLKVDTGMHRMGVAPEDVDDVIDLLTGCEAIDLEGIYTHFSVADGSSAEDRAFTRDQIARFDEVVAGLAKRGVQPRIVHAANSAGALGYPEARGGMVRVGLALYGYLPEAWLASALGLCACDHHEPEPPPASIFVKIRHLHSKDSRNPRKGKKHDSDQGSIPQTLQVIRQPCIQLLPMAPFASPRSPFSAQA